MSWLSDIRSNICCLWRAVRALQEGGGGGTYTAGNGLSLTGTEFAIASPTAVTTGTLAQFAATTSAQLAGVISDETGFSVGALAVFNINPVIDGMRPINGLRDSNLNELVDFAQVASAVNYVQFTNSATGNAPTISAAGDNTNVSLTLEGKGTGVVQYKTFEVGFRIVPSNVQTADYTTVLEDNGKAIDHPVSDNNARAFTIDGSLAYPIGACLTFTNMAATACTIPITTDTMYLAGVGTTGTRTLAQYGVATARKTAAGVWLISGSGLT
jgi:hypothetical protein